MQSLKKNYAKGVRLKFLEGANTYPQEPVPMAVQGIIAKFKRVFDEPSGLPPPQSHDPKIILQQDSKPTCVRPYRYP